MTTVKYDRNHHAGSTAEARIASRLRNSGASADVKPDHVAEHGTGPLRTISNVHSHGQGAGAGRGPRVGDKQS